VLPAEALDRIRAAGGRASGSINGLAKLVGSQSKTSCHRLLHELAGMGLVTMTTGRRGVAVALP
jgi:predicted transcriptional regulator